jgi:putative ABC transport system permease protein
MNAWELLSLVVENLARRKGRVALTAVGVIIGTAAVILLVSLGSGLQRNATEQLSNIGDLTFIQVYPSYEEANPNSTAPVQTILSADTVTSLQQIPGVQNVVAQDYFQGGAQIRLGRLEGYSTLLGVSTNDLTDLGLRAQQGTTELSRGNVVVGFNVAQNFYDPFLRPGQEPPPPPELLGETLTLHLQKWSSDGTMTEKTVRLTVQGVLAESRGEADWSIYLTMPEMEEYNAWSQGVRQIDRNKIGFASILVRATDTDVVLDIADQIKAMGYQAFTPQSFIEGINGFYTILQIIFGGVGAIALLVAAIGIANTMAMAILERTREIGLMKAVGATNRHVLSVFLGEAAGIGFVGGLGGVLIGWGLSEVANVFVLAYMAGQAVETGAPPPSVAVSTPFWLPVFALLFATLIGLLSGLYPALTAATMSPISALKYE